MARFHDPTYRLDPVIREKVSAYLDADALERLCQYMDNAWRDHFVASLLPHTVVEDADGGRSFSILSRISDPVMNELLEDMWQPFWDQEPMESLEDPHSPYPGRERALRRRHGATPQ